MSKQTSDDITYSKDKRNFGYAAKSLMKWLANPVSEEGPKYIYRIIYSALGPEVHKVAKKLKDKPESKLMLDNREDLGQLLADLDTLGKYEEGTVGQVFHSFMDGDGIVPGYIIGGMVYSNGHFDKLVDWEEDAKFLMERAGNTHDITHMISGYGTDFCGEVLNLPFSIGGCGISSNKAKALGAVIGTLSYFGVQPKVEFKDWVKLCIDSGDRGAKMAEHNSIIGIHFEAILDQPLQEARKNLKIPPHKYPKFTNKDGWVASKGWTQSKRIKKAVSSKTKKNQEKNESVKAITALVESGIPIKKVMSSNRESVRAAYKQFSQGSSIEQVERLLA